MTFELEQMLFHLRINFLKEGRTSRRGVTRTSISEDKSLRNAILLSILRPKLVFGVILTWRPCPIPLRERRPKTCSWLIRIRRKVSKFWFWVGWKKSWEVQLEVTWNRPRSLKQKKPNNLLFLPTNWRKFDRKCGASVQPAHSLGFWASETFNEKVQCIMEARRPGGEDVRDLGVSPASNNNGRCRLKLSVNGLQADIFWAFQRSSGLEFWIPGFRNLLKANF